jgi:hypothetical protein
MRYRNSRFLKMPSTYATFLTLLSLVALVGILPSAAAGRSTIPPPVLVELFTSEGCSSCPPADRLLMELDRSQVVVGATVVVLSEHVDYWNGLGWRDPFSSAQWSQRQSEYARHFGLDSVYTPQIVVNGVRQVVGSDGVAVREAIRKSSGGGLSIRISDVRREDDKLRVSYSADAAPNANLYAVLADASDRSNVVRGENAGRTLEHVAVARCLIEVASLQEALADKTIEMTLPQNSRKRQLRLILFAQRPGDGLVIGVAEREL